MIVPYNTIGNDFKGVLLEGMIGYHKIKTMEIKAIMNNMEGNFNPSIQGFNQYHGKPIMESIKPLNHKQLRTKQSKAKQKGFQGEFKVHSKVQWYIASSMVDLQSTE